MKNWFVATLWAKAHNAVFCAFGVWWVRNRELSRVRASHKKDKGE